MSDYVRMVLAFDNDRWHHCLVLSDWCEEHNMPFLSKAWKWIADNKRWPYKHRDRTLYGWYMVPIDQWDEYKIKRESAIPNILIGEYRILKVSSKRRARYGKVFMENKYVPTISKAMSNLAGGLAKAISAGAIK
jgi:hypothetical protein